jgi:cellulose synthase operon protein C
MTKKRAEIILSGFFSSLLTDDSCGGVRPSLYHGRKIENRKSKACIVKIIRTLKLWFREGTSDRVYEVDFVDTEASDTDARYLVNVRHGKRGRILKEAAKTRTAVSLSEAEKLFDSVVVAKINEGYRQTDEPPVRQDVPAANGRDAVLLARLEACVAHPAPEKERDRLFWRLGEVRLAGASSLLLQLAPKIGLPRVSYSLVWALARCTGGAAADVLKAIATEAREPLVRALATFALISPLMGDAQITPQPMETLPDSIAHAISGDFGDISPDPDLALPEAKRNASTILHLRRLDALHDAFTGFAQREPLRASLILVELYRLSQADVALHALLAGLVRYLPVRPPFVPGLRRLFKYAEMLDDGAMFGAVAQRFDMAQPMYRWKHQASTAEPFISYVAELAPPSRFYYQPLTHLTGAPDAVTAMSENTIKYFKRRIWRALRKRGELGQQSFLQLATGYLLAFKDADEVNSTSTTGMILGPLSNAWGVANLLYHHCDYAFLSPNLTYSLTTTRSELTEQGEAFPDLWAAHPEYALRLAMKSQCKVSASFAVRILQRQPSFLRNLNAEVLEQLLSSPYAPVVRLAMDEARTRLSHGKSDINLIAALLVCPLSEAREMAIAQIERETSWPWKSPRIAFIAVTSSHEDVCAAALKWCSERRLSRKAGESLAPQLANWLLTAPDSPRIRHLRTCLPHLWPKHDLPLPTDVIARLMAHIAHEVRATGIEMLAYSPVDANALPEALWRQLFSSEAPEIVAAGLRLLARLNDEQLSERAAFVVSLVTAPTSEVRKAARPLLSRIAERFPELADDLARRLIDTLFQSALDDDYVEDTVTLFREALPTQFATLDANLIWRLLQAKAKGAQSLGAAAVATRVPSIYSVRQLARLGNHPHVAVRQWVMAAYDATPNRFAQEAADAVLLVESKWEDARAFATMYFDRWADNIWTPGVLAVIADSTRPEILAYARSVLRRTMKPGDASVQLIRLLEHPATSMHLLISEVLTADAARDETVFAKLLPLARIVMLQVHKGRVAKDRISAFLHTEALRDRDRAVAIAPIFVDLSLSAIERDRTRAVTALRDIETMWPGLTTMAPLKRVDVAVRTA